MNEETIKTTSFFLSIFNSIFSAVIFISYILFKARLSKQDVLLSQKYFFQFLFNIAHLCYYVYIQLHTKEIIEPNYKVVKNYLPFQLGLIIYLVSIYILTFFINLENYLSLKDPTHVIRDLITKKQNYLIIDLILIIICSLVAIIYKYIFYINKDNDDLSYDISCYFPFSILLLCLSIITLILFPLNRSIYPNYRFRSKNTFTKTNSFLFVMNIIYFLFASYILISKFLNLINNSIKTYQINQISVYTVSFFDCIIMMLTITFSSFYYYVLGDTNMYCCYCCFGCKSFYSPSIFYEEHLSNETDDFKMIMVNLTQSIGFVIEDYIAETFDYILNITTTSMALVYQNFSDGNFSFIKSKTQNDFNKDTLFSKTNTQPNFASDRAPDLKVEIQSLFSLKSKELMNIYHFTPDSIIDSLLSHKYKSLLCKNSKEQYFKSLNSLCIKTYDKKLLIEIRSDISIDKKENYFLNSYYNYLNDSQKNTFLPILLGVFKIKINSFQTLTIFISSNPLINDIPKENYNYWQLMRFEYPNALSKLSTSKDKDSFIVTTEIIFDKNIKFEIEDFAYFKKTIEADLNFFRKVNGNEFSLLILFYEFDLDRRKNPNTEGFFENSKNVSYFEDSKIKESEMLSLQNTSCNRMSNVNEILMEDNEMDVENENKLELERISMISFNNDNSKMISMKNGFECKYNGFNGKLYFSFENLFSFGWSCKRTNYYSDFAKQIIKFFKYITD